MPSKKHVKHDSTNSELTCSASDAWTPYSLSHSKVVFGLLPYDVKYQLCRDYGLTPIDLFHLSHVNKEWYECASEDDLFTNWYNVRYTYL